MKESGILAPVFSLPSPYGSGTFGEEAYKFIDRLAAAGQSYWQILPLGPTAAGDSPYQPDASFAYSKWFIDPELLRSKGLLSEAELKEGRQRYQSARQAGEASRFLRARTGGSEYKPAAEGQIDYPASRAAKRPLLLQAFRRFCPDAAYRKFLEENQDWLKDAALFSALSGLFGKDWTAWHASFRDREPKMLEKFASLVREKLDYYLWTQFEAASQWAEILKYAHSRGIRIIGDVPIYTAMNSADVWSHQEIFQLDAATKRPASVSGCPPDAFAREGQFWGNPLYDWEGHRKELEDWWTDRVRNEFSRCDVLRIDHFRGFESYFSIPASTGRPADGHWVKGPGAGFFETLEKRLTVDRAKSFIAEDLGFLTEEVFEMIRETGIPGMKVLQFGFDSGLTNPYLPRNYTSDNCLVYTGTHDNDTSRGWYESQNEGMREWIRRLICAELKREEVTESQIPEDLRIPEGKDSLDEAPEKLWIPAAEGFDPADALIRLAFGSRAHLAVIPLQDWLGLDGSARINTPSTPRGNWRWQLKPGQFTENLADHIRKITAAFGRK